MRNKPRKQGIFKRIFILYAIIMLLALIVIEVYITDTVRDNHIHNLKNNLAIQAALISDRITITTSSSFDELCGQMKEKTGARVTIIALDGKVLGDSDTASALMDNHAHRQELQQALLDNIGMAVRLSDTLKYDFLYVAKKITHGDRPSGFIRLSVPLTEIDRSINLLRLKLIAVVCAMLAATGAFSLWQIDHLRRFTARIQAFSRSIARGELGKKLFLHQAGEFNEIAESLNIMSGELKRNIAASEEEKRRLNVILRNIPDSLFIIDANGIILLSSLAARRLFGETALQGRPFIEVVRNSEFLSLIEDVRKRQKTGSAEIMINSPLEQYCVVQVSPLFYNEQELSGFVAVFHDITQLHKLEQTRKDFVANISHELKTPITAIMGFAETLLDGALNDRENATKFLETISSNSERINNLVDDLMTISKIELGVTRIEKAPQDIEAIMTQVVATLRDKAAEKGIALTLSIDPELKEIQADKDRLFQVLTNLADNAIKFTDKGSVLLGISEEAGKACLFVEDTGIGIAQKHLPRLGERFYRVDPGRSRNMGGTGLGLAIVKHLVKAHGWDMLIESTPGKGTKVRILVEQP